MPHATLKLVDGVNTTRTPTLNEACISSTSLVRIAPDTRGNTIIQKIGGWVKWFPNAIQSIVRALWAWEDTNALTYLGVGAEYLASNYQAQLSVISDGNQRDITPRTITDNVAIDVTSTSGSSTFTIVDAATSTSNYYSVFISTHISIGGVVLFGLYTVDTLSGTSYQVTATGKLGDPVFATSSVTNGGDVAQFDTTSGDAVVLVTLPAHGFEVGDTFPILIPTQVGGVTLYGNYIVLSVPSADTFNIQGSQQATSTTSAYINGQQANFTYFVGIGPAVAGTGYGAGGYGSGGYGTGTNVVASTGIPVYATDWALDNWGEILVACSIGQDYLEFTPTAASGTGTHATLTFDPTFVAPTGATVVVAGMDPSAYNGVFFVTSSAAGSITYASAATGSMVGAGTIRVYQNAYSPLYYWRPTSGAPIATIIPNCPVVNQGAFVAMPQRQIMAYGSTETGVQDPPLIRWCDVDDFTVWTGTPTNQAGKFRIPRGSRIVGGLQGPQQSLFWTDLAVWAAQYIGPNDIYSFNELGTGCGLIDHKAVVSFNGIVVWMGQSQFFKLGANGVELLQCPIWDVVFQNLDSTQKNKIRAAANSRFGEVAWYYPSKDGGGEVDSYVKVNLFLNQWDYGPLGRTAWINESVLGPPIGAGPDRYIYQHEVSTDADGEAINASFQTGYFAIAEGDQMAFIDEIWPDMKWGYFDGTQNASVNLTFYGVDYPGDTPRTYGPYTVTQSTKWFNPRIRARLVAFNAASNDTGTFWRLGGIRYRVMPDGKY